MALEELRLLFHRQVGRFTGHVFWTLPVVCFCSCCPTCGISKAFLSFYPPNKIGLSCEVTRWIHSCPSLRRLLPVGEKMKTNKNHRNTIKLNLSKHFIRKRWEFSSYLLMNYHFDAIPNRTKQEIWVLKANYWPCEVLLERREKCPFEKPCYPELILKVS